MTKALVPTMGALHAGHLALVDRAHELADEVVVSIFVNPTQFGAGEDFDRYPRTLEADRELLAGRAQVFAPAVDDVYPPDNPPAVISAGPLGAMWEGASRPGHFDGVLTVVNRLFELVRPDVAVFGEKDWQQLALIRAMAAERHPHIQIVGVPTVRDADGLALSSRNRYLSPAERETAALIPAALRDIAASGGTDESLVRAAAVGSAMTERAQYRSAVNGLARNGRIPRPGRRKAGSGRNRHRLPRCRRSRHSRTSS